MELIEKPFKAAITKTFRELRDTTVTMLYQRVSVNQ